MFYAFHLKESKAKTLMFQDKFLSSKHNVLGRNLAQNMKTFQCGRTLRKPPESPREVEHFVVCSYFKTSHVRQIYRIKTGLRPRKNSGPPSATFFGQLYWWGKKLPTFLEAKQTVEVKYFTLESLLSASKIPLCSSLI